MHQEPLHRVSGQALDRSRRSDQEVRDYARVVEVHHCCSR